MTPEQFKAIRQSLGLSQTAMADRIGVTMQAVYYYERGMRGIPKPVQLLLEAQRVYAELLEEKGGKP